MLVGPWSSFFVTYSFLLHNQNVLDMQAVLSRAELLLSSGCSDQPALDAAVSAMEGAVAAWSRVEADETEKRRKEAEILKYKMQEHLVSCSWVAGHSRLMLVQYPHVGAG